MGERTWVVFTIFLTKFVILDFRKRRKIIQDWARSFGIKKIGRSETVVEFGQQHCAKSTESEPTEHAGRIHPGACCHQKGGDPQVWNKLPATAAAATRATDVQYHACKFVALNVALMLIMRLHGSLTNYPLEFPLRFLYMIFFFLAIIYKEIWLFFFLYFYAELFI